MASKCAIFHSKMKYTVHTKITYSTEFDSAELKKMGITTKKQLIEYAKQNFDESNITSFDAEIFDSSDDKPKPTRRGTGSY